MDTYLSRLKGLSLGGQDLVQCGCVKALSLKADTLHVVLELPSPTHPKEKEILKRALEDRLLKPPVRSLRVVFKEREQASGVAHVRHIVAIASGKGGVGKSSLTTYLAFCLHQLGWRIGILDADIYGPSQPFLLGLTQKAEANEGYLLPLEHGGVRCLSMGSLLSKDQPTVWRGPMAAGALKTLLHKTQWGPLDLLLVDMPPGTGDIPLTLAQSAPLSGAVIVSTPQDIALLDAEKALRMFQKVEVPLIGIIENMSSFACPHCGGTTPIFGQGGGQRKAEEWHLPLLGSIPLLLEIQEAGDPVTFTASASGDVFIPLARQLMSLLSSKEQPSKPQNKETLKKTEK